MHSVGMLQIDRMESQEVSVSGKHEAVQVFEQRSN